MPGAKSLIRAFLGNKVFTFIRQHAEQIEFWAPDAAFAEAREPLPAIVGARGIAASPALELLELVSRIVQTVEAITYFPAPSTTCYAAQSFSSMK